MNGEKVGALNYFQNAAGMTNISVEDLNDYDDYCYSDYQISKATFQNETNFNVTDMSHGFNDTDASNNFNDTDVFNGFNDTDSDNPFATGDRWEACKIVNKVMESVTGDNSYESRLYNDIFFIGAPPSYRKRRTDGNQNKVWEEKFSFKYDKYEGMMTFGGRDKSLIRCILDNNGTDTNVEIQAASQYYQWSNEEYINTHEEKINIDVQPSKNEEDDFNLKISYNDQRIFDGWFYLTALAHRYARENLPAIIDRSITSLKDGHAETTQKLSQYF